MLVINATKQHKIQIETSDGVITVHWDKQPGEPKGAYFIDAPKVCKVTRVKKAEPVDD